MFGIHLLPEYKHYWSTNELLGVPAVAKVTSRTRFVLLSRYFHVNDNAKMNPEGSVGYDSIFKVCPLFDLIQNNSINNFYPGKNISFDEAMIALTGSLTLKQYIKNKPSPWGIKTNLDHGELKFGVLRTANQVTFVIFMSTQGSQTNLRNMVLAMK